MTLKFSDRIGVTSPPEVLQVDDMSEALRNSLWNYVLRKFFKRSTAADERQTISNIRIICEYFFKLPIDNLPYRSYDMINWVKAIWFNTTFEWYDIYNLIEFIGNKFAHYVNYQNDINTILKEEMSGYRYVGNVLSPITNFSEIESIASSIESAKVNQLFGTSKHLETAIALLSLKPKADYRNSIKESISAVESLVKQLMGEEGGGLDKALAKFDAKVKFHGAFKAGLLSLYGYTSDEQGIRHAILEEADVGFDEAKFMLVSCSALVNFLISKASNCGLL